MITSSDSESMNPQTRFAFPSSTPSFCVSFKNQGETKVLELPKALLEVDQEEFSTVISKIFLSLNPQDIEKVQELLPKDFLKDPSNYKFLAENVLRPGNDLFSPLKATLGMLKNGVFSSAFRKKRAIEQKLDDFFRMKRVEELQESLNKKKGLEIESKSARKGSISAPKVSRTTADSSDDSVQDIILPNERLDENPGDTTFDSEYEEDKNNGIYSLPVKPQKSSSKKPQEDSLVSSQKKVKPKLPCFKGSSLSKCSIFAIRNQTTSCFWRLMTRS